MLDVITVDPLHKDEEANLKQVAEEPPRGATPLQQQEVYGKVTKVEDRFCKLEILAVNEQPTSSIFLGII